jgi:predicted DNA-binding protein (MmcQ/YjbR family)
MSKAKQRKLSNAVRDFALSMPGAYEDHPWGETVVKVNKKVFVFLGRDDDPAGFGLSVKLPVSGAEALSLPFTEPTHYGLGKSGWVTARVKSGDPVPLELLVEWVQESYRAVAPKKLVAQLEDPAGD